MYLMSYLLLLPACLVSYLLSCTTSSRALRTTCLTHSSALRASCSKVSRLSRAPCQTCPRLLRAFLLDVPCALRVLRDLRLLCFWYFTFHFLFVKAGLRLIIVTQCFLKRNALTPLQFFFICFHYINQFHDAGLFLSPWKHQEAFTFQWVEKQTIDTVWVNLLTRSH